MRNTKSLESIAKAIEDLGQVKRDILLKVGNIEDNSSIVFTNLMIDKTNELIRLLQYREMVERNR